MEHFPDGSREVGGVADVAGLSVVFLAVECWCNRAYYPLCDQSAVLEWQLGVVRGC